MSNPYNFNALKSDYKHFSNAYKKAIFTMLCIQKFRPDSAVAIVSRNILYAIFMASPEYMDFGFSRPGIVIVLAHNMSAMRFIDYFSKHWTSVQKFKHTSSIGTKEATMINHMIFRTKPFRKLLSFHNHINILGSKLVSDVMEKAEPSKTTFLFAVDHVNVIPPGLWEIADCMYTNFTNIFPDQYAGSDVKQKIDSIEPVQVPLMFRRFDFSTIE